MIIKYVYIPNGYTNCYILADEKTKAAAIIDPGDTVPETPMWRTSSPPARWWSAPPAW